MKFINQEYLAMCDKLSAIDDKKYHTKRPQHNVAYENKTAKLAR
jgi:hypothetical protein